MAWRKLFHDRLRALLHSDAVHDEIDEEVRFHIEMRTEENVRRGMPPEEARREAERRFGPLTRIKEMGYEVRGGGMLETLRQDLRYGARMLLKKPGFTLIAVLTLSLGIGANTAIFSVVNAVLLRPLPYPHAERLVNVGQEPPAWLGADQDFLDYHRELRSFERLAAYTRAEVTLTGEGDPERVRYVRATEDFFPLLGVAPLLGRTF